MRKEQEPAKIQGMFNRIAGSYDFLNHFFSFNIDARWRRQTVREAADMNPEVILDVAAGTFDLSLVYAAAFPQARVLGLDFAIDMLKNGLHKLDGKQVYPVQGDGMQLPVESGSVDIVSIAFGIRNLLDMDAGLREFYRVLKPGGRVMVLEFTPNRNPLFRFYSGVVMPLVGRLVSKDRDAYAYLHRSVQAFPSTGKLKDMMENAGFSGVRWRKLTFGIAALHIGERGS